MRKREGGVNVNFIVVIHKNALEIFRASLQAVFIYNIRRNVIRHEVLYVSPVEPFFRLEGNLRCFFEY